MVPADVIEQIVFKVVEEYEQHEIHTLCSVVKNLLNLLNVSKEFKEFVLKRAFPYLESLMKTDMPSDIPWNTITSKPNSVRVKDLRRANKYLGNSMYNRNKRQLIKEIFTAFEIEKQNIIPAKILWEFACHGIILRHDEDECIVGGFDHVKGNNDCDEITNSGKFDRDNGIWRLGEIEMQLWKLTKEKERLLRQIAVLKD